MEKLEITKKNTKKCILKYTDYAQVTQDFFDKLNHLDDSTQRLYLDKMNRFIENYKSFFDNFNDKQKLLLFNTILQDKHNISCLIGDYPTSYIYYPRNTNEYNTMWENMWKLILKLEKKRLIQKLLIEEQRLDN